MKMEFSTARFVESENKDIQWRVNRASGAKTLLIAAIFGMAVMTDIGANASSVAYGRCSWNTEQVIISTDVIDSVFGNSHENADRRISEKRETSKTPIKAIRHDFERMSASELKEFEQIEEKLASMDKVEKITAWFNTGVRSLEIRVEFADGLRLDMDRYYHDREDNIETHFKLSENGEILYRDIMPMQRLVESMGVFFANL